MNRNAKRIERNLAAMRAEDGKMSRSEKLALIDEIERIINSQHVALIGKITRLRQGIEQEGN